MSDEIKKEIENLKNEAVALKQQNEREYKEYGVKSRSLMMQVQTLKKDKESLEEYLAGKVVEEKKKVKEVEDKQIKQLNKANELVNESLTKRQEADEILEDSKQIQLINAKDINKRLDDVKNKEGSVLVRSVRVSEKESVVKGKLAKLDARDKQQDVRSEQLHKEAHEGGKKLKEIIIKEKIVEKNLKAIETNRKDAQKSLRENILVLEKTEKMRKDIGEKQYLIKGKEEVIADKERKLEVEQRKIAKVSAGVKATIIKLDARRENLNTMYKKFKEGGN